MIYRNTATGSLRRALGRAKTLALLLLVAGVATACTPSETTKDDKNVAEQSKFEWQDQVVNLKVTSSQMMLGESSEGGWSGTGVIVAPGIMVTNAHVAWHAVKIDATTDRGEKVEVTRVLALDQESDLAVLAVNAPGANELPLIDRPDEPRALRTEPIVAVGNTADLGLSVYDGIVNNISDAGYGEVIFHNANISSGSSGGPLFDKETQKLIGVNHAISHGYRFSIAIPAWTVSKLIAKAKTSKGRALAEAFTVDETTKLKESKTTEVCLDGQTAEQFVFPSKEGLDVGIRVAIDDQDKQFGYNLHYALGHGRFVRLGSSPVINSSSSLGFTTPKSGYYVIEFVNVSGAGSGNACANVTLGAVDWEASLAGN